MGGPSSGGQDGGGSNESNRKARKDTEVSAYEKEIENLKLKKKLLQEKSTDDSRNTNEKMQQFLITQV